MNSPSPTLPLRFCREDKTQQRTFMEGKFHTAPKVDNSHFPFAIFYLRFVIGFRSNRSNGKSKIENQKWKMAGTVSWKMKLALPTNQFHGGPAPNEY